jgi:hypothetical protein
VSTSDELSDLLAGPIVRRAEGKCVWIWVATRLKVTAFEAKFDVCTSEGKHLRHVSLPRTRRFKSVKLGIQLYVNLLPLTPRKNFRSDEVYVYDVGLRFDGMADADESRWVTGLLPQGELNYSGFNGPTFRIPSGKRPIVQGSCRRPGAKGQDAFLALDHHMNGCAKEWTFPQALFLTGDQIYADDVVEALFDAIQELSPQLLAFHEFIPFSPTGRNLNNLVYEDNGFSYATSAANYRFTKRDEKEKPPLDTRRGFCVEVAKFTTGDGEGHLLGLNEYAAMYLLVWSGVLCRKFEVETRKSGKHDGDPFLENFAAACRAAQRVLANVPTYMICDDHDVTDDWNIDELSRDAAQKNNPAGRRIIANAIAAYWAFQGWGNNPDDRAHAPHKDKVEDQVDGMISTGGESNTEEAIAASEAFAEHFLAQRDFGFVAPTEPRALFVDTRTQREFHKGQLAPALLSPEALTRIGKRMDKLPIARDVIVVLPCPAMPTSVTLGAHQYVLTGTREAALAWDAEQFWNDAAGPFPIIDLIATRVRPKYCFIFSGDVHHGYVIRAAFMKFAEGKKLFKFYEDKGSLLPYVKFPDIEKMLSMTAETTLAAIQVTSSPIKNYKDKFEDMLSKAYTNLGLEGDPAAGSDYSLGEHLTGEPRMVMTGPFGVDGAYLQHQVETDVVDEKGARPFSAMDRAVGAPHFVIFSRPSTSEAVVRFIGLRRARKKPRKPFTDDFWSSVCKVDLTEFS